MEWAIHLVPFTICRIFVEVMTLFQVEKVGISNMLFLCIIDVKDKFQYSEAFPKPTAQHITAFPRAQ